MQQPASNLPEGVKSHFVQVGDIRTHYLQAAPAEGQGVVIAGTPKTVIEKVKYLHERCRVGHLLMMNQAGFMTGQETRRSMELFAKEVYPEIRDMGESRASSIAAANS